MVNNVCAPTRKRARERVRERDEAHGEVDLRNRAAHNIYIHSRDTNHIYSPME